MSSLLDAAKAVLPVMSGLNELDDLEAAISTTEQRWAECKVQHGGVTLESGCSYCPKCGMKLEGSNNE